MRDSIEISGPDPRRLTGRHVLAALIAFFGVVFSVNGYFLMRALSTHTGVVVNEPYRKGLAYNTRITADARQAQLGWHDDIQLTTDGTLTVAISDRDGVPVSGLSLAGVLARPSTASADIALRLTEVGGEHYIASAGTLAPGAWIAAIEAHRDGNTAEPVYRARRRLWLEP